MTRPSKFILAVLATLAAGPAFAHAHLKTAAPADKASVASVDELDLGFSEEINLRFSGVRLLGPDKAEIRLGEGMLKDGGKQLAVPVGSRLSAGVYTVEWHVLSTDGHKTNGNYMFTVTP